MTDFKQKYAEDRLRFFSKASELLAEDNWGDELLKKIEKSCDMKESYSLILFPGGMTEILGSFEDWQNDRMMEVLSSVPLPEKIRERIAFALGVRILSILPKKALANHLSYSCLPPYILQNMQNSLALCDVIWKYAGDQSTDFNYYTKRGLLFAVYGSILAFYLSDESPGNIKTKEYINSSLDSIVGFAKTIKDFPFFKN